MGAVALLMACAALACAAPAQARIKAKHPTVSVSTVLPPVVMTDLARAHVPLSNISVVVEKVGDRTPIVALNAGKPMSLASRYTARSSSSMASSSARIC